MKKLAITNAQGENEIIEIESSGSYLYPEKILWDERTQGPIPEQMAIDINSVKDAKESKRRQALNSAMDNLKELDLKSDLSAKDLQKAIKALVRIAKNAE